MDDKSKLKSHDNTRCGYAALVGEPNAGKSTLLNAIVGESISIVTSKPQTTRNKILAVYNQKNTQVIFLDTPGLHRPVGPLGEFMVEEAKSAVHECDVCVWLIDVTKRKRPSGLSISEKTILTGLEQAAKPIIVLLNKIDALRDKQALLPLMEELSAKEKVASVIPISASKKDGIDIFLAKLAAMLPKGPKLYPEDILSEQAERFFAREIIRKHLTDLTRQELPYQCAVVIDKFVEEPKRCAIHASIHVERAGQRGIVLGSKGVLIKEIGTRSRLEIERFLSCPVDLRLHVEVSPGWTKSTDGIKKMGYE